MKQYLDQQGVEYLWGRIKRNFANLSNNGKVPASQLPSYIDDVEEYESLSSFPSQGEEGKIYVAKNTNLTYRWSGSTYVEISQSIALGETSNTAYPGDKGKQLEDSLDAEINRAKFEEADIRAAITAEKNRAEASEIVISNNLSNEIDRANSEESKLAASIATETSRATTAENSLSDRITKLCNVSNFTDEEDLTSVIESDRKVLKLADRNYDPERFSGKGYKILRRNIKSVDLAVTTITVKSVPVLNGDISITINNIDTHITLDKDTHNTTALVALAISDHLKQTQADYNVVATNNIVTLTRKYTGQVAASAFDVATTGVTLVVKDSIKSVNRNILTQAMINQPNTIYEIRYDFDANGETINIPENCTLKFKGGNLNNGTIKLNYTVIDSKLSKIFSSNLIGSTPSPIYVEWFGAKADGKTDSTEAINKAIKCAFNLRSTVKLSKGTYIVSDTIKVCNEDIETNYYPFTHLAENPPSYLSQNGGFFSNVKNNRVSLVGEGSENTIIRATNICDENNPKAIIELAGEKEDPIHYFYLKGITVLGPTTKKTNIYLYNHNIGISLINAHRTVLDDICVQFCAIGIFSINSYWLNVSNIMFKYNWYGCQFLGSNACNFYNLLAISCYCGCVIGGQEFVLNQYNTENCYKDIFFLDTIIGCVSGGYLEPFDTSRWLNRDDIPQNCFTDSNIQLAFDNDGNVRYGVHITFMAVHSSPPNNNTNRTVLDAVPKKNCNVSAILLLNCRFMGRTISRKGIIWDFGRNNIFSDTDLENKIENSRWEDFYKATLDLLSSPNFKKTVRIGNGVIQYNNDIAPNARVVNEYTSNKDFKRRCTGTEKLNLEESGFDNIIHIADGSYRINSNTFSIFGATPVVQQTFNSVNISNIITALKRYGLLSESTPLYNTYGISDDRPTISNDSSVGFVFFDKTLNKPIWWTGRKWVDATGADV